MPHFRDLSIRHKLTALFMVMSCLGALLVSACMGIYDVIAFRHAMAQDLVIHGDVLAANSTGALAFHDPEAAREVLQVLRAEPNITAACIYTATGEPFARYTRDGSYPAFFPPAVQPESTRFAYGNLP